MITAMLRPYEGVIAAESGHINQHEAGAVEAGGHKVLALPHTEGKLSAKDVDRYITDFYQGPSWSAMVAPGMVYISHPTEYGTLYTLDELEALSEVCRKHHVPLFLDGARLGYALAATGTDVTLEAIASLCCEGIERERLSFPDNSSDEPVVCGNGKRAMETHLVSGRFGSLGISGRTSYRGAYCHQLGNTGRRCRCAD